MVTLRRGAGIAPSDVEDGGDPTDTEETPKATSIHEIQHLVVYESNVNRVLRLARATFPTVGFRL